MSDSMSKYYDDEEEWADFKNTYNLKITGWDVYSNEASWAKRAVDIGIISPAGIKLYVRQQQELHELKNKHAAETEALRQFEKLGI